MPDYSIIDQPEILRFIFHPEKEEPSPLPAGSVDINIPVDDKDVLGCRFYLSDPSHPCLIYFHGNGETVNSHNEIAFMYNKFGINLFVVTYRGYGWSTGTPTVSSLMQDCKTTYTFIKDWMNKNQYTGSIFVMGRSLGSAAAIELCSTEGIDVKGMIIESGFADSRPLAKKLGIEFGDNEFNEKDGFNNKEKISNVSIPTYILHGQKDSLIPVGDAEQLQSYSGARSKQFQMIPGADHNTMISTVGEMYFSSIKGFVDKVSGVTHWGYKKYKRKK